MIRKVALVSFLLTAIGSLSGCTDFVEPNQLAFVIGTAVDRADDGNIEISHQIVVPTQRNSPIMGESSKNAGSFVTKSAKGRDVFEASQRIQLMMSRKLLTSHRSVIAIGEAFFESDDVTRLFDKLNRDPANNQRDVIVIVKGRAQDFLKLGHPMEHLSSIAIGKEMRINGLRSFSTRQFLIDCISDEHRPLVPFVKLAKVKLNDQKEQTLAEIAGFAMLNQQLKVKAFLNESASMDAVWMAGKGSIGSLTIPWKNGKGMLSFRLTHLSRRIRSIGGGEPSRFELTVNAQAYLLENTSEATTYQVEDVLQLQQYMNEHIAARLQSTMDMSIKKGTDIYGIGAYIHRKQPRWWRAHKLEWDDTFKRLDIQVKSNVRIRASGTSG